MNWNGLGRELRNHGLKVKKVPGWQDRGREGLFDPRAVFEHHTASARTSGNAPCLGIVTHGRSDLPGPLANFVIARDGTVIFVAKGRCNHAGEGGPHKGIPKDSGNAYALGIEIENDGRGEPYGANRTSAAILTACLLKRMKRTPYHAIAHKEWTDRKIDPSFDMQPFRKRVRNMLKAVKVSGSGR